MKSISFLLPICTFTAVLLAASSCHKKLPQQDKEEIIAATTTGKILQEANPAIKIGVAVKPELLAVDPSAYRNLVIDHFNRIGAENAMKMRVLQPTEGNFDFSDYTIQMLAKYNGLKRIHGHTLIWHNSLPTWVTNAESNTSSNQLYERFDSIMSRHIRTVVNNYDYAGTQFTDENGDPLLKSWDVVNEALYDDGTYRAAVNMVNGKDKGSVWYRAMGKAYIEKAYRYARRAARANLDYGLKLFYNDYGHEYSTTKLDSIYKLVMDLKVKTEGGQTLLNGVGLQFHLNYNSDTAGIGRALRKMASTGLYVHISELDIRINPSQVTLSAGEISSRIDQQKMLFKYVAQLYRKYVPTAQQYGITLWSLTDADSGAGQLNGVQVDYPCVFDTAYGKKNCFYHFYDGLHDAL